MTTQENIPSNQTNNGVCPAQQDIPYLSARYYETVKEVACIKEGFAMRLFELRSAKGVSAREMSLSLGQGPGYINNLENGHNLPSMTQFFAICEYLGITPSLFFSFAPSGGQLAELQVIAHTLSSDDLQLLLTLANKIRG